MLVAVELLDLVSCDLYPAVQLSKGVCHEFGSQRCCFRFPWNSAIRWVGPKMILRLVLDLVDRFANSL